jgi:hypothetical protein
MPRWMYGESISESSLGPIVPTDAPSSIDAPFVTDAEPRCVSVTEYPSVVATETTSPLCGTFPTKVTLPPAAARTFAPVSPPMSMPRC